MGKFENVKKLIAELEQLGAEEAIVEIELMAEYTLRRVKMQRILDVHRIRLYAIDRNFDFEAVGTKVVVRGDRFAVRADVSTKEFSAKGEVPFGEEELFAGMSRMEFGEKYGHNSKHLRIPHYEATNEIPAL